MLLEKMTKNSKSSDEAKARSEKGAKSKKSKFGISRESDSVDSSSEDKEVLLSLPAGLKYKLPGKQQRIIIGSIVVGLNLLLVIAVIVYFYSPDFQSFIYNLGRQ